VSTAAPGVAHVGRIALFDRIAILARIAWRDLRGSRAAALIILGCLALGVATITGIGSLRQSVTDTVDRDARALLGGDLVIESPNRELPEAELAAIVPADAAVSRPVATNAIVFADNGGRWRRRSRPSTICIPSTGVSCRSPPARSGQRCSTAARWSRRASSSACRSRSATAWRSATAESRSGA
jgi:hypothetical protein